MASKEVNNNVEKISEDLLTLDISDEAEVVQSKEAWSRSSNSISHDVMYDPQLLKSLPSADDVTSKFSTFACRPLQSNDYNHGFISLLRQLTSVGSVSESDFQDRFNLMKNCKGTYYNTVIVDRAKSDQIIASSTLIVEKKFIHSCANRGVIEEVIVSDEYRGKSLGKQIVKILVELGKHLGCYKITLNCNDQMVNFYKQNGLDFTAEENNANFLVIRVSNSINQEQSLDLSRKPLKVFDSAKPKEAWGLVSESDKEKIDFMYDPVLLEKVPSVGELNKKDPNLYVRQLQSNDYKLGFIDVLKQLTSVGNITESSFRDQFNKMKSSNGTYYQTVIVDKSDASHEKIIGSATIIIERKFIHDCANRGLIEDVIVCDQYRGKKLGQLILQGLIDLGKSLGCYKITLNCKDKMISFYERFGFVAEENNANFLVIRVQ